MVKKTSLFLSALLATVVSTLPAESHFANLAEHSARLMSGSHISRRIPVGHSALASTRRTSRQVCVSAAKGKNRVAQSKATRKNKVAQAKSSTKTNKLAAGRQYLWSGPAFNMNPLKPRQAAAIRSDFNNGFADNFSSQTMVRAGVFAYQPLQGGVFIRRQKISHIILHSTETAQVADASTIIRSWNNRGGHHPGTQFIVDRDGTIFQTVDPVYGTMHVDSSRTLGGINNDNTIGIETVRTGKQKYTIAQMQSLSKLVTYLQGKFSIPSQNILAHGQVQPSDRTDPVNFSWKLFAAMTSQLNARQTALGTGSNARVN